ncbi:MAG TPA: Cof-type HAD-IIB family hydrolase [Dehalococcoidia bacterium]
MGYRLLALDCDGTLLNPEGHVSPRVREAVTRAAGAGCHVTLATGRRAWSVKRIIAELGINVPLVLYNGGLIWDAVKAEALHQRPLARETVRELVALAREHRMQAMVFEHPLAGERVFLGPEEFDSAIVRAYVGPRAHFCIRVPFDALHEVQDPLLVSAQTDDPATARRYYDAVAGRLPCSPQVPLHGEEPHVEVHVYGPGATKANALAELAGRHGLTMADVMVVGDDYNDVEMLEAAGLGVAMGHAPALVKRYADVVVGTNAEDGVAEAIERFVLGAEAPPRGR